MRAGSRISWIQLEETQLMMTVRLPVRTADGRLTRAIPLNNQNAHMVPTTLVSTTATLALKESAASSSRLMAAGVSANAPAMWWRVCGGRGAAWSVIVTFCLLAVGPPPTMPDGTH